MKRTLRSPWLGLAAVVGLAYPLLVFLALPHLSPRALLAPALALIALRLLGVRGLAAHGATVSLLLAGGVLILLGVFAPELAVRAYPVAMSLAAAAVFGLSLLGGPSLVEQIARRQTPDLPDAAIGYTRKVTMAWTIFLTVNAIAAAALAVWGTLAQWTLWNGLLSYLAAGVLMASEWFIRQRLRRRGAA
jgi:uncharacterized membrane protein